MISIDPDHRLHVSDRLLEVNDGPMLEALKGLGGARSVVWRCASSASRRWPPVNNRRAARRAVFVARAIAQPKHSIRKRIDQLTSHAISALHFAGRRRWEGLTILLVEQNLYSALGVADRVYILESGRIVHEAPATEIARDLTQLTRYLGVQ
jgi:hypothetical protein